MAGYEKNSKIIESYETLAKLLNSDKKENIDKAYDALRAIADNEYSASVKETEKSYARGRDILAVNRAKADKYMNYFLQKGGYEGSGIAADVKLKSEMNYNSQVSALNTEQREKEQELARKREQDIYDIEAKRAGEQSDADSELAELEYKIASDKADRELRLKELENEEYWNKKQYELNKITTEYKTTEGADSDLDEMIAGYRMLLYNSIVDDFGQAKTVVEMESVYNTVTGVNAEKAVTLFGEVLYSKMIKDMKIKLIAQKKAESYEKGIEEIFSQLVESPDIAKTMATLQLHVNFSKLPKYTREQVDIAFKRYHNYKNGEFDFSEEYSEAASE